MRLQVQCPLFPGGRLLAVGHLAYLEFSTRINSDCLPGSAPLLPTLPQQEEHQVPAHDPSATRASDRLWQQGRLQFAMREEPSLKSVSDDALLHRLSDLLKQSRRCEADLIAHIGEVDARRLYAREAAPSMFVYCTRVLHLSETEAWLRITAARAAREHPMLLSMLRDGRLHLSGIRRLAPHLTRENRDQLLKRATHKSRREIDEMVAELAPRPDTPSRIRKLPQRRAHADPPTTPELRPDPVDAAGSLAGPAGGAAPHLRLFVPESASAGGRSMRSPESPVVQGLGLDPVEERTAVARRSQIEPLAPARYKVEFTADAELRDQLLRLQALMRTSVPDGDLATIIDAAVTEKLERLEAKRFAKTKKPRKSLAETDTTPKSRHIPAAVRRIVHERDGGRCTCRDNRGRRCTKRHDLEFHHRAPFARGGEHSPEVLCLMCKTHNTLMAEHDYGKEVMARFRRPGRRVSQPAAVRSQPRTGRPSRASRGAELLAGPPPTGPG